MMKKSDLPEGRRGKGGGGKMAEGMELWLPLNFKCNKV